MAIITLTTDLSTKNSYLASVKGAIYSQIENIKIVDISNDIIPFNIQEAAFVLRNCFKDFPIGTVHIVSVDDELSINSEHVAVKANGHYFVGPDNGLFSLLLNEIKAEAIVKLNITQTTNCTTFATKNIFVPAACHLARGGTMEIIGVEMQDFETKRMELKPVFKDNILRGAIIFTDSYGNVITNISKKEFTQHMKGDNFTILFGREDEIITKISTKYKDVPIAEKLAIFGENNLLQIAINQGKANKLLGLKLHEIIRIEFK
mgnify:CR=1 FL=1|tara:strand:- start:154 stop:939 length:786 start_codon:yes stop_codon:yes gene_type:complete